RRGPREAPVRRSARPARRRARPHREREGRPPGLRTHEPSGRGLRRQGRGDRQAQKGAVGMTHVLAAEGGYQEFVLHGGEWFWLVFSAATAILAVFVGFFLMRGVLAADQGTPTMREIADAIQEGAMAYLKRQFKTIAVILVPLAILVFLTSTRVASPGGGDALSFAESGIFRTLAFLTGCLMSGLPGFIGMSLA